jgi:hypothetical protein
MRRRHVRPRRGWHGERVAREPLTGRVRSDRLQVVGSGPVGERATPTRYAVRGPYPWDRTRDAEASRLDRANSLDYIFQCPSGAFERREGTDAVVCSEPFEH